MQDPNEDTEWNDLLRAKGILPAKEPEVTEEALTEMIEQTIQEKQSLDARLGNLSLEGLAEIEDDEDEAIILEFRRRRLEEMKKEAESSKFGEVIEISGVDYINQVNKAGTGIYVFLHLYKPGIPQCTLINQHFTILAAKFPKVKFIKSISTTCIPNFPDRNLPAIFVYFEGAAKKQFIGPQEFSDRISCDELEWMLSKTGGIKTDLESDPRGAKVRDVFMSSLGNARTADSGDSDEGDW
ncbi:viral IAP-associated factor homolog [Hyalella azteca]|uniref:Viral IAP-associated factor homolog n=1 Tax=Hyalella azteca TaxID=294128 RepID=A0A8B7PNB2_HYAAZ|nr:viral IAP-associated factor homolog [Hyalella azteca]